MYLRHSTVRKDGKTHTYWRLVRSVRRSGKVVQETVAHLGELDAEGRLSARRLARRITGRGDQADLFEETTGVGQVLAVRLDQIRLERSRRFGDVWLSLVLWRALGLEELCRRLMPPGREEVPGADVAAVLVLARLCEPSSELPIAEDWYRTTALEDLLGITPAQVNDDRLYRCPDRLLTHKTAIEEHLRQRLGELFALEYDRLLYDVTSTYFEGLAQRNPQAKRGYSRDHRGDCKQVLIALVVTKQGIPLGYEVFDGNRVDVTTVEEIVSTMESRFGLADRIATLLAPSSTSSLGSRVPTSCSPPLRAPAVRSACDAWCDLTRLRRRYSTASACACPSGSPSRGPAECSANSWDLADLTH
jgi:hypothetical protein